MSSNGKLQSRSIVWLLAFRCLKADSVSFRSAFWRLIRLTRYACSLKETQLLSQVGKGERIKRKLIIKFGKHSITLILLKGRECVLLISRKLESAIQCHKFLCLGFVSETSLNHYEMNE